MDTVKIGRRLRELREQKGQTKRSMSRILGIPYRTICAYEYGERMPTDTMKIKLAAYFGRSVESIFFTDQYSETR